MLEGANAQITVTLNCIADAAPGFHDGYNSSNNNYGTVAFNPAFFQPSAAGNGYNGGRTLLNFNFNSIPSGVVITSAYLKLYGYGPCGNGQATSIGNCGLNYCKLYRVTSPWVETSVTWNNQPSYSTSLSKSLHSSVNINQNYPHIVVTALVQEMLNNPSTSFGFLMKLTNETMPSKCLVFCSRENVNVSNRPQLVVTYMPLTKLLQIPGLKIYPNPCVDELTVTCDQSATEMQINLMDLNGKVVKSMVSFEGVAKINTTDLKEGVYLILILNSDQIIMTRKIIIE